MPATVTPETDPDTNPHWHLSTAQHAAHFTATHTDKPMETWTAADIETWFNLRLAT